MILAKNNAKKIVGLAKCARSTPDSHVICWIHMADTQWNEFLTASSKIQSPEVGGKIQSVPGLYAVSS
jgi:hypothetical protein